MADFAYFDRIGTLKLLRFLYGETSGAQLRIVSTSLMSALTRGVLLTTFNAAAAEGNTRQFNFKLFVVFVCALVVHLITEFDAARSGDWLIRTMVQRLRLRLCESLL